MYRYTKLNQLVYLFAFFPFVNFGIPLLSSDTQPFYFFIAFIIIFFGLKKYEFDRSELFIIFLSILATVITFIAGFEMKKSFNLLVIAIASIFFYRHTYSLKLIRIVLGVYCAFFVLWLVNSSVAFQVQSAIVRNINDTSRSFRGIPLLATEAGLYAGTGILLVELYIMKLDNVYKKIDYILIGIILSSIILSFSGTSIVFLMVFLLIRIKKLKYIIISILAILFLPEIIIELFPNTRLSYFLGLMSLSKSHLILSDTSIMYRFTSLLVSIDFFMANPFGALGIDNVPQVIQSIYYQDYYDPTIGMDYEIHLVSGFGYALICSGLFALLFFFFLMRRFFSIKGIIYFLLCISFSYSLIYPVSLILLIEKSRK